MTQPPNTKRHPVRDDRGSDAVETALLAPVGLAFLAWLIALAITVLTGQRISGVAGIAARDASLARSASSAQSIATSSATAALASENLHCTNIRISVDTSGFNTAPGTNASITVDVWCTVDYTFLGVRLLPGSRTLHDRATSPLDAARDISLGFRITDTPSTSNWSAGLRTVPVGGGSGERTAA